MGVAMAAVAALSRALVDGDRDCGTGCDERGRW